VNKLTIEVVNLEEKPNFVVGALTRELVHGVNKLLQGDGARVVFVEDLKNPLREEGLR
jgi:hypothetical protein